MWACGAVVKSFMSSLYKTQRSELCRSALSSSLAKRMTYQNLLDALRLSLDLEPGWAIQARLAIAFGASAARRSVLNITWVGFFC